MLAAAAAASGGEGEGCAAIGGGTKVGIEGDAEGPELRVGEARRTHATS